ncbi:MAG: hypothetical protein HGB11_00210, partial [Chlorobiales bacterium]|nr:hypothetical protein [Chlorobiales bacterium]
MPVKKATSVYGKGGMNCAQSILCGFKEVCQIVDADIDAAASAGRGGSERGFCGALHAALILARQPETKKALEQAFLENAGSIYCRDICLSWRMSR